MTHMKKVLIAIGKAAGFALLFLFAQLLVVFAANIVFTAKLAMESFGPYGTVQPFDELLNAALAFMDKYGALLTGLGDLLAVVVAWAIFRLRGKRLSIETGWHRTSTRTVLMGIACGMAFAAAVCIALSILPIPEEMMQTYDEASSDILNVNTPLVLLALVFVGPIAEEVYFRGLVYTRLKRAMPYRVAMILSSLIFAVIHGDPVWIAYAFCAGLLMCAVYERSGSLWTNIAFHCAFNLVGTYISGFIPDMTLVPACLLCFISAALGFVLLRNIGRGEAVDTDEKA